MLKPILIDEAEVNALPEVLRGEYKKNSEGKYILDVADGMAPKAQVDEMRDRNIVILRERDAAARNLRTYEEIGDLETVSRLKSQEKELADANLIKKGKLEEVVTERTEAMRKDFEKKQSDATAENQRLNLQLSNMMIDQEVTAQCAKLGVRAQATPLIVQQVKSRTKMENGRPVVYKEDGVNKDYNASSHEMTVQELAESITTASPFLLEPNGGGGSQARQDNNGNGKGPTNVPNYWKRGEHFNLTEQMKLVRKNPQLAARLKEEAGIPA